MTRRLPAIVLSGLIAIGVWPLAQGGAADSLAALLDSIESRRAHHAEVARQIWEFAELGYQEQRSSALLQSELRAGGFDVKTGVADMPTAFVATYGSGPPSIGFIAEFDALPGLSQEVSSSRRAAVEGAPGHGCGHNLLGTGSIAAALALAEWLASSHRPGTLTVFGTPAQEGGAGKVYMVRAGLLASVDTVVSWHPGDRNDASASSTNAYINAKFRFHGVASHAASAPEKGRSALDGVEAMNHMINLLREHLPQETRVQYIITRGGSAPNVVPDLAEVYYDVRHRDMPTLDGIWNRIVDAARGAALGTGTTMDVEVISAVYNLLPNEYLSKLMRENLLRVGGVTYAPEDQLLADEIRQTLTDPPATLPVGSQSTVQPDRPVVASSGSDLGDVSWNVPTVTMTAATSVPGVPNHSWQAAACAGSSIGAKGMIVAAKTMALTAAQLLADPRHLDMATAEFDRRRGAGFVYKARLGDREPPLDYRR